MHLPTAVGHHCIVEGLSQHDHKQRVKFALAHETVDVIVQAGLRTAYAQFAGIVEPRLTEAVLLFKGLKRPLFDGSNMNADASVLIYVLDPEYDVEWVGGAGGHAECVPPPAGVFVVLVKEITEPNEHGLSGLVEHWNWTRRDSFLKTAPVGYRERYSSQVWSR